jgi:hypothetical protein
MRIRNLKDLDRRIHELELQEKIKKQDSPGQFNNIGVTNQMEWAVYIGRVAAEVFKAWRQPVHSGSKRWKNVLLSILLMIGIQVAQRYLDKKLGEGN